MSHPFSFDGHARNRGEQNWHRHQRQTLPPLSFLRSPFHSCRSNWDPWGDRPPQAPSPTCASTVERLLGGALPACSFKVGSGKNSPSHARIHRHEQRRPDEHSASSAHLQAVARWDFDPESAPTSGLARSSIRTTRRAAADGGLRGVNPGEYSPTRSSSSSNQITFFYYSYSTRSTL
jgi:hypothetical protein